MQRTDNDGEVERERERERERDRMMEEERLIKNLHRAVTLM